jgi:hypothetical protein
MPNRHKWSDARPFLALRAFVFSLIAISSLMELATSFGSLTMFKKIEDGLAVLLVPFLVWEVGAKILRGTPEHDS